MSIILPKRFALLKNFSVTYLLFAFIVRLVLYALSISHIDFSIVNLLKILGIGFLFDIGSLLYVVALYVLYLLLVPTKFHGSKFDRIITKVSYTLFLFFLIFCFLAEIPFWQEYQRRFNFIAVDYLLYTYEVVQNIHQSFPLPLLILILIIFTFISLKIAKKSHAFKNTFESTDSFKPKLILASICFAVLAIFHFKVKNTHAEVFTNINESELAKSGLYSFFAARQSNELNYTDFYKTIPATELYPTIRSLVKASNDSLTLKSKSIKRFVKNSGIEQKPNVIFIGLESLSTKFMKHFGNDRNWTPTIDSLANSSIFFTNIYATGTRTIRGMEAISLAIPPTPGRSIVKRENNDNLFTIGQVFKEKGYSRTFIYGGDGYFDNMTNFFSHNGFDIIDRIKNHRFNEKLPTKRTRIEDDEVTFENAWAACDGDVYNKLLNTVDEQYKSGQPFFNFVMNSSNHKPYTYPEGVVDSAIKGTREGAVKYTDKALWQFFEIAKNKPWFSNTVFIIMADHCASSAGRTELNIANHHIPAYIYNLKNRAPQKIAKLASQIDIFPTLFGYLNWSYTSNVFGKDITKMTPEDERALIGNHRKIGLLKKDKLLILERFGRIEKTQTL